MAATTQVSRFITGVGTAAIDSTAAQTLVISAQWSAAAAGNKINMHSAILERIS